jgi:hypothetical protein
MGENKHATFAKINAYNAFVFVDTFGNKKNNNVS